MSKGNQYFLLINDNNWLKWCNLNGLSLYLVHFFTFMDEEGGTISIILI
jgi:hypothetical protein